MAHSAEIVNFIGTAVRDDLGRVTGPLCVKSVAWTVRQQVFLWVAVFDAAGSAFRARAACCFTSSLAHLHEVGRVGEVSVVQEKVHV